MNHEFRGQTLSEAIHKAIGKKNQPLRHERQIQRCRVIDHEMQRLGGEIDRSVAEIASVSEEMRVRIERLGHQDKIAATLLAINVGYIAIGLGAVYKIARRIPKVARVPAAVLIGLEASGELSDIISAIDDISPKLNKIREGIEISGPRRKLRDARNRIEYANRRLGELAKGYHNNQCRLVFGTFGR